MTDFEKINQVYTKVKDSQEVITAYYGKTMSFYAYDAVIALDDAIESILKIIHKEERKDKEI